MHRSLPGLLQHRISAVSANVLSTQQLQAKAVFSQDLADCHAREAEAQKQSLSEKKAETTKSQAPSPDQAEAKERPAEVEAGVESRDRGATDEAIRIAPVVEEPQKKDEADVIMLDVPPQDESTSHTTEQPMEQAQDASGPMAPAPANDNKLEEAPPQPEESKTTETQVGTAAVQSLDAMQEHDPPKTDAATLQAPAQAEPSITTALDEMDFDSMFPDITTGGDASGLDLGLDFSANTNIDSDMLGNQDPFSLGDASIGALETETLKELVNNDDMNTLLPGLESYANAVDDITLIDLPLANPSTEVNPTGITMTSPGKQGLEPSLVSNNLMPQESTVFDDLFFGSTDLNLEEGAGAGEFDDALFGLEDK